MEDKLIEFETAKLAKEKGFEKCSNWYHVETKQLSIADGSVYRYQEELKGNDLPAPTQSLLQKWLREKHNINIMVYPELYNGKITYYHYDIYTDLSITYSENLFDFKTYEEALEFGLQEALKLIE